MSTKLKKSADGRLFVVHECPHCGANLRNKAEDIGQPSRCKTCSAPITVPGQDLYQAYLKSLEPAPESPSAPVLNLGISDEDESLDTAPARPPRIVTQSKPRSQSSRIVTLDDERDAAESYDRYAPASDDYLKLTAVPGETVLMRFGPATAAVVGLQVLTGLGILLWVLILVGVILTGRDDFRDRPGTALGGTFIMAVYGFCILVLPWLIALLKVWHRSYVITNRRILSKSGLASLNAQEVRTGSVSGMSVKQSFLGRLFGFGTVHVFADGTNLRIFWVDHPVAIAAAVRSAVEASKS